MKMERYSNAFEAIADTPADAALLSLRSDLMNELRWHIEEHGWTQVAAAKVFGVTQPRISDLMRGKMSKFGLEGLIAMAVHAGLSVRFVVTGTAGVI